MSWHLTGWLGEVGAELEHAEFRVLFRLCHRCNQKTGVCVPSISTIAAESKMSERTVYRALDKLVEGGWIEVKRNFNERGQQTSNSYRINAGAEYFYPNGKSVKVGVTPVSGRGDMDGEGGVTRMAPKQRKLTENTPSSTRAKQIDPNFMPVLTATAQEIAGRHSQTWLERERQKFVDHYQAHGKPMKDWQAAFRKWLANAERFEGGNSERPHEGQSGNAFVRAASARAAGGHSSARGLAATDVL